MAKTHPPALLGSDPELLNRFFSKIDVTDGCWLWTGGKNRGYGRLEIGNRHQYAHRVSWEIFRGAIPDGLDVLHFCDTPACVRPGHLFTGTQADNVKDMWEKGRGKVLSGPQHWSRFHPERLPRGDRNGMRKHPERVLRGDHHYARTHPELLARGEKNGCAKLTEAQVLEIRSAYACGATRTALAQQFGVSLANVCYIVKGQTWRHL